jgi:hypothetical protein
MPRASAERQQKGRPKAVFVVLMLNRATYSAGERALAFRPAE